MTKQEVFDLTSPLIESKLVISANKISL